MKKYFITKVLALLLALFPVTYQFGTPLNASLEENAHTAQYVHSGNVALDDMLIIPFDIEFDEENSD